MKGKINTGEEHTHMVAECLMMMQNPDKKMLPAAVTGDLAVAGKSVARGAHIHQVHTRGNFALSPAACRAIKGHPDGIPL